MKRLLSTILALTLLCSMSIPAFAAEGEMSDPPMSDNSVQTDVEQEPDQPAAPVTVSTLDELKSAIAAAPNVATIYIDNCIMISDETVSTEKIITLARADGYAGDLISLGSNGGISGFTFYDTRDFSNTIIVGVDAENAMIERCIFSGSENALTWFICVCGSASVVNCYFADGGFAIQNTDIGTVTVRDCTVVGVSLPDGESPVLNNGTMTMEHTNVYQNTSGVLNNGNLTVNGCEIADNISTGGVDIDNRGTLSISADTEYRGFYKTDTGEEVTLPLSEYSDPAMFVCLTEEQAKEYFAPPATPDEEPTPTPEPTPEPDVEEPTTKLRPGGVKVVWDMRAFLYCRVAREDSFALEHQRFLLQLYAKQAGYTIIGAADEYGSGLTLDRPALQKVTEAVVAGKVDVVLVHNLTRIGREWGMTQRYIDLLTRHKVKLLCIRDRLLFDENGATPILIIKNAECPL